MQVYLAVMSSDICLIAKRPLYYSDGAIAHQAGQWVLPGGGQENGETEIDGAFREFREETNKHATLTLKEQYNGTIGFPYRTNDYSLVTFTVFQNILNDIYNNIDQSALSDELESLSLVQRSSITTLLGINSNPANPQGHEHTQSITWFKEMAEYLRNGTIPGNAEQNPMPRVLGQIRLGVKTQSPQPSGPGVQSQLSQSSVSGIPRPICFGVRNQRPPPPGPGVPRPICFGVRSQRPPPPVSGGRGQPFQP